MGIDEVTYTFQMNSRMSISYILNPEPKLGTRNMLNEEPLSLGLHDKTPNIGDSFKLLSLPLDGSTLRQTTHRRSPYGPDFPYRNILYDDIDGLQYMWSIPASETSPNPQLLQENQNTGYMAQSLRQVQETQHYLPPGKDPSNPYSSWHADNSARYRPSPALGKPAYAESSYYSASHQSGSTGFNTNIQVWNVGLDSSPLYQVFQELFDDEILGSPPQPATPVVDIRLEDSFDFLDSNNSPAPMAPQSASLTSPT